MTTYALHITAAQAQTISRACEEPLAKMEINDAR